MKKELIIKELNNLFHKEWQSYNNTKLLKDTYGWDSLKQIQLILLIEKKLKKKTFSSKYIKNKKSWRRERLS